MKKKIFAYFLLLFSICINAQDINEKEFNNTIFELNNNLQFKESFVKIYEVIDNKSSTNYDKYLANIAKCYTYKRVFNYPNALKSLDEAFEFGMKSDQKDEVEIKILVEKLLIYFDQEKKVEFHSLFSQIKHEKLELLDPTTRAFYNIIIADINIKEKKYNIAYDILIETIDLLKRHDPPHLSNVYIKLSDLYRDQKNFTMQLKELENANYFAYLSKIDIYKVATTYAIAQFYILNNDYKNATNFLMENIRINQKYNFINKNLELINFEKNYYNEKLELENKLNNNIRNFFISTSIILFLLIITLFKLYQTKKKNHKLAEKENIINRNLLKKYLLEESKNQNNQENNYKKNIVDSLNLTTRQKEIIELVKQGKTNKQIGSELFISENTVKYHLKTIFNTLGIENRNYLLSED